MRFINTGYAEQDVLEFLCEAEYGIQEGDVIRRRITGAKNEEEAREAFEDHIKREYPVEYKRAKGNIRIAEIIAEPVEDEEAV